MRVPSSFDAFDAFPHVRPMKTTNPLLVSPAEAGFQLSSPREDVIALVRDGDLVIVKVCEQVLVVYESLTAFTRRTRRNNPVVIVQE
jgi:hypothetical protein